MNVILHTNHCPRCRVLETKLKEKNIEFEENNNVEVMMQRGFRTAPVLEVDGIIYEFKDAVDWIGEQ